MKLKHLTAVLLCMALTVSMIPSSVLADEMEGETGKTEVTETAETTPKETAKPTEKEKPSETEATEAEPSKESEYGSETTETAAPSESVPSEEPAEPSESIQPTKKTVPAETHKSSKKGTVILSGGSKLKTIGTGAFARCSKLSSFTITSKVLSKIGTFAFNKDYKLKTLYIRNTTRLT